MIVSLLDDNTPDCTEQARDIGEHGAREHVFPEARAYGPRRIDASINSEIQVRPGKSNVFGGCAPISPDRSCVSPASDRQPK